MVLPPLVIDFDGGGYLSQYEARARELALQGRKVVIRGVCASACTMMIGRVHDKVCVKPRAELWFHQSGHEYVTENRSESGTRRMMDAYPVPLKLWIERRGGLTAEWLKLKGAELRKMFRPCHG